ncbi:MAG: 2Fe-2S iron-sulfur cluster binding domain-containing protein [Nitrospiraceae bacterium]|nr:2Fe-2S iron-sulfur cluster binding domain-containing protein [Nitrospiraceae bacterium]
MSEDTITILIDGKAIQAEPGQTIMQAADAAGLYIPRLCGHKDLPPGGHCRVCTVKVNGRPASACTFPAVEGQVIESDTDEINTLRRTVIEMLFVEGNHTCPACEASGNCELQALGYRLGLVATELPYLNVPREMDASHKDVYIDRGRCVLCGRCVRASKLVDGKTVFGFAGRGIGKRVAVDAEHALSETAMSATDKAASICPTGCLVVKGKGWATPVGKRDYDTMPIGSDIEQQAAG